MQSRRAFLRGASALTLGATMGVAEGASGMAVVGDAPRIELTGDWQIRVTPGTLERKKGRKSLTVKHEATLTVEPATLITVKNEKYDPLPLYNPGAAPWSRGAKLRQLVTFETTAAGMLAPESLVLKPDMGDSRPYTAGKDYEFEHNWATFGRLPGGIPEGKPVWADYVCGWGRIDSLVVDRMGVVRLLKGKPHNATPLPASQEAEHRAAFSWVLANLWIPGRLPRLREENIYPILEPEYSAPIVYSPPLAAKLLPKTWKTLHQGAPLRILAWGDSVTAGGQASDPAHQYQSRFVAHLKERFPRANIELITAGWGGRNSDHFLKEPPGSQYNFDHAVIEPKPDLIVMEFVNDAYLTAEQVEQKYSYLYQRFEKIGAEWIILTPHYVRPDWMGATSVRVEDDPRPYVAGLRQFAKKHNVALADASLRWGHLLKEGIPYTTLLSNSINHPDDRGHEIFALSLMELFL